MNDVVHGPAYQGGKSGANPNGAGRWIAERLPWQFKQTYCEPYAGMLGVLLQRKRSQTEIINDLNDRLVNWWEVVRDHADEFAFNLWRTPYAETEYARCRAGLDDLSVCKVERARRYHVVLTQSLFHTDGEGNGGFGMAWREARERGGGGYEFQQQVGRISDRLRHAQVLCRPALGVVERLVDDPSSVVYIDPPYPGTFSSYRHNELDVGVLGELMTSMRGRVAISGYGDTWDHLGWHRSALDVKIQSGTGGMVGERVEVLWTNYEPPRQASLFEGASE